jgi:hypothetical protein
VANNFFAQEDLLRLPHPPYSPDLAPSDFWLFGHLKTKLAEWKFKSAGDLYVPIHHLMGQIPAKTLRVAFDEWVRRVDWVIKHDAAYYDRPSQLD